MNKIQSLRLFSIAGAFLVGFWLPIRLIGYVPPYGVEICFDLLVSMVAGINLVLYFKQPFKSYKDPQSWFSFGVVLDVLCLLPLSLIAFVAFDTTSSWILFLNLFCARHIRQIKPFLDHFDSLQPMSYRLIPIFLSLPLLVHLVACGWIALGSGTAGIDSDAMLTYVKAVYWSFTTLTTVGYGDISAKTIPQMLFTCGIQVVGVGVFGYILSNVASLISRSDAAREHHMDNLDKIETFMQTHHIPTALRSKTRAYYHYLWTSKKGYRDHSLLEDLPSKLQSELFLYINKSVVEKVPFLKGASNEMIEDLMNELEPRIFVPGEKIFKVDEPGDALYFIHSGSVEIQNRDRLALAQLGDGAFFGEMALLNDRPRSATAQATSYCDVFLLHRESFDRVTKAYPEFKQHLEEIVQKRVS
ncbi:MAG: cyclic nucleotide-binding domain-containing protein [Pseudobdellovibrionaceae bacterium]